MPESTEGLGSSAEANSQQPQAETQKTASSGAPEGYVQVERLNGALKKIEELTLTNRSLHEQLVAVNTRLGELQAQGTQKEAEWTAKAGEHSKSLKAVSDERDTLQQQIAEQQAQIAKIKMISELGHYPLLAIADQIPLHADKAKQKEAIERMAAFTKALVDGREKELTAGNTVVQTQPETSVSSLPETAAAWEKYINSLPLLSPERQKAFDDFFEWSMKQGKKP